MREKQFKAGAQRMLTSAPMAATVVRRRTLVGYSLRLFMLALAFTVALAALGMLKVDARPADLESVASDIGGAGQHGRGI